MRATIIAKTQNGEAERVRLFLSAFFTVLFLILGALACSEGPAPLETKTTVQSLNQSDYMTFEYNGTVIVAQGDYEKIPVNIPASASYELEDVEFSVKDHDATVAKFSKSKDPDYEDVITLISGSREGVYTMRVRLSTEVSENA